MDPNTVLHALLTKHNLNVVPCNGWLTADGRPSAITASDYSSVRLFLTLSDPTVMQGESE